MDKDQCEEFFQNRTRNPMTGKKILVGGPKYREISELCKKYERYTKPEEILIKEYCSGINNTDTKQAVKELMKRTFTRVADQHILERQSFNPFGTQFCHHFVPADKGIECVSGRRHIVVLDFMGISSVPLSQDFSFCDVSYTDKIKYYIQYIPVLYDAATLDLTSVSTILNSSCNTLLIHVDFRMGTGNNEILYRKFIKLVNTYLAGYEIPKVIYSFMYDRYLVPTDFPNVNNLRILNIAKKSEYIRVELHDTNFIRFVALDALDDETTLTTKSDRLSCQWWFKRFFSTVFECGKGRLVQFSGTCYITAAFNMIILGEYTKKIIIDYMNNAVEQVFSPADKELVKIPIEYGACERLDFTKKDPTTRIKYYAKIFYNTICVSKSMSRINPMVKDIFDVVSRQHFASDRGGDGGLTQVVLFGILTDLSVNFWVVDSIGTLYSPYQRGLDEIAQATELFRKNRNSDAMDEMDKVSFSSMKPDDYPDIILYISTHEGYHLPKISGFEPETSNLSLEFTRLSDASGEIHSHAICGFECDGYYKLYDSDYNIIDNCDWTDPRQLYKNAYTERRAAQSGLVYKNIYIENAIFINESRRTKYIENGTCSF